MHIVALLTVWRAPRVSEILRRLLGKRTLGEGGQGRRTLHLSI
jgi:hypothetical protein